MDIGFLNGIYYVKTESMLNEDDFNALKRLDKTLFFKYLKTRHYGYRSKYSFLEEIIVQEMINVKEELNALTKSNVLANIIYASHDIANIKIVYKSVKYDMPIATYDRVGSLSIELLIQFFKHDNERLLPNELKPLFASIKKIESPHTQIVLQEIEKKVYDFYEESIKNKKIYKPLYKYLKLQKVIKNLKTLLKLRTKEASIESFQQAILEEDVIGRVAWLDLFEYNHNDFMNKLFVLFDEEIVGGVQDFITTDNPKYLNEVLSNYLSEKLKVFSYDYETVGPIIYYLYLKEIEMMKVRALYYDK